MAAFTIIVETSGYDAVVVVDGTREGIERDQAAGVMRPVVPAETAAVLAWMHLRTTCRARDQRAGPVVSAVGMS